jgi:protein-tyrosine phosphatase
MDEQTLHNSIVLQPSVSDRVLPLILIDIRPYSKFSQHIRWSIHVDLSSIQTPQTEQQLEVDEVTQILEYIEKKCFRDKNSVGPFHWRRISSVVIYGDDCEEDIKRMNWLYRILVQEAKSKQIHVLKCTYSSFIERFPYMSSISNHIQDTFELPTLILEKHDERNRLYLGSHRSANDSAWVNRLGIKYILNCAHECGCVLEETTGAPLYLHLPLHDALEQEIPTDTFETAAKFVHDGLTSGNVLVHCLEGRSRSVTITCAYLMIYHGWTVDQCLKFFAVQRPLARPNPTFIKILHSFEQSRNNQCSD